MAEQMAEPCFFSACKNVKMLNTSSVMVNYKNRKMKRMRKFYCNIKIMY